MAELDVQQVNRSGVEPAFDAAAGGGDTFRPDATVFLHVKNGGEASVDVTIETPRQAFEGAEIADTEVTVPDGEERLIGPFPANHYADPDNDGLANISYSGVTSVTVAALKV